MTVVSLGSIVMLGDKHGPSLLPPVIAKKEMKMMRQRLVEGNAKLVGERHKTGSLMELNPPVELNEYSEALNLLSKWYKSDRNAVPEVYTLMPVKELCSTEEDWCVSICPKIGSCL